jgi:maltose/moltooligosaccharide transporter
MQSKADPGASYRIGTIQYTKIGLIALFVWLLWGDFCFNIMETVVPSIIPLQLHSMNAPNWLIGLIVTSIPYGLTIFMNPVISVSSDRYRSRWGRRIPYLAAATPFVAISLILLGFSKPIGKALHAGILPMMSEQTVILLVIAIFMIAFQVFNMFINSVFYYLFNDVVPAAFLGRFMAMFRMVGSLALAVYNGFVIGIADTHMPEIFLAAAVLYLTSFGLMAWKVKEADYPPPEPLVQSPGNQATAMVRAYFKECFGHRIYWYFFLANACYAMSWPVGAYSPLLAKSVGVPLALYGQITAITALVGAVLLIPAGLLVDRLHPLRMLIGATALILVSQVLWLYFLIFDPGIGHSRILYVVFVSISVPIGALYTAAEIPMYMRLLSRERYGQYCSANAMFRAITVTVAAGISGGLIDLIAAYSVDRDYAYRFVPVWLMVCFAGSLIFLVLLYREWKQLGGDRDYRPPV